MNRAKWTLAISVYLITLGVFAYGLYAFSSRLMGLDIFLALISTVLAVSNVAVAVNIYWLQTMSDFEITSLVMILSNSTRRAIVRQLLLPPSRMTYRQLLSRMRDCEKPLQSLGDLEINDIVREKYLPEKPITSKILFLNPGLKKILKRIRQNL